MWQECGRKFESYIRIHFKSKSFWDKNHVFSKKSCWYKISDTTCMSENMPGWRGVKLIPSNKSQIVCASSLLFGTCSGSRVFSPSISAALNWGRISLHWTIFVACFCVLILSGLQSDLCCLQHWYVTGGKSRWLSSNCRARSGQKWHWVYFSGGGRTEKHNSGQVTNADRGNLFS